MITFFGAVKGGVGKSTLACACACWLADQHPGDVLLIDGDKQGTAMNFATARAETLGKALPFAAVRAQGAELREQVRSMADKYRHIVIDAGGQDNPSLRAGLLVADQVIIPTPASSFDAWSLDDTLELVSEAQGFNERLKARFVVSRAQPRGNRQAEAQELAADYPGLDVIKTAIVERVIWQDLQGQGLSPLDPPQPDAKAAAELQSLVTEIFNI